MRIAFFDIQPCEKEIIAAKFKKGQVLYFEQSIHKVNLKLLKDVEVVSIFVYSKIDAKILDELPALKMIATRSTGFDHIDLTACRRKRIIICNVPTYGENTVAEHTFMLLLALMKKLPQTLLKTAKKKYDLNGLRGLDLHGRTMGVIGAGRIGKNVIKIAKGFGMDVLTMDITKDTLLAEVLNFKYVSLRTLLKNSDIISLHTPYNPDTHHLLNSKNMKKIKPGAMLLNTARGGLIDSEALLWALDKGIVCAAGLDVLEEENLIIKNRLTAEQKKNPLYLANKKIIAKPNVLFTPHNAFNTEEAIDRITQTTIENIIHFYRNDSENIVKAKK